MPFFAYGVSASPAYEAAVDARAHARAEARHLTGQKIGRRPDYLVNVSHPDGVSATNFFVCHALKGCSSSYLLIHDFWLYLGLDSGKRLIQVASHLEYS